MSAADVERTGSPFPGERSNLCPKEMARLGTPPMPDQDFFSMSAACRIAQVPPHTLRYWESQIGLLRPARRSSGHRRYSRGDLELIFELKRLLQGRRLTIAGARKVLLERKRGSADSRTQSATEGSPAALRLLREVRKELAEMVLELSK